MSSSTASRSLPPGYRPPLMVVNDFDHSAYIVIATAIGLACLFVFVVARVVVRYSVTSSFGLDDWLLASSVMTAIIQSSVLLYGCSVGLGSSLVHLSLPKQNKIQKMYYVSKIFWVLAMGISKISVTSLLRRIEASKSRKVVFNSVVAFLVAWTVASTFSVALQCDMTRPWVTFHEQCTGLFLRWQIISAFDIISELLLLGLAIYLVSPLQTSQSRKTAIVAGFAARLPIIIAIAFRLATFDQAGVNEDPSLRETLFIVWTQTELNFSIISATIPGLLQFMRDLNTQFGGITEGEAATYGGTYNKRSTRSFPMSILRSVNKTNASHSATQIEEDEGAFIQPHAQSTVVAMHPEIVSKDSMGSNDSQRMIIQREVAYHVEYEERSQE